MVRIVNPKDIKEKYDRKYIEDGVKNKKIYILFIFRTKDGKFVGVEGLARLPDSKKIKDIYK